MPLKTVLTIVLLSGIFLLSAGSRPADILFAKHTLDLGANESAAVMDVNGDGRLDIVSGEIWMEQPKTQGGKWTRHHFRDLNYENGYIDNFSDLPLDVNGDGNQDLATANASSDNLSILLGDGVGSFGAATNFDSGTA